MTKHEVGSLMGIIEEALTELDRVQKKETPLKVEYVQLVGNRVAVCPVCKMGIWSKEYIDNTIMYTSQYCNHCGQKLDWSDEK